MPYFTGPGGVTPPGGNQSVRRARVVAGWTPDLRKSENRMTLAFLVKFKDSKFQNNGDKYKSVTFQQLNAAVSFSHPLA